jgi:diguanylate cyclase (GGDEF)-like protein
MPEEAIIWEKDNLTKCYTRNALFPFLKKLKGEYGISKRCFSVMLLDLNHFKTMNDKHGHMFGDEALKYFSSTLRLSLEREPSDSVADKFVFRFGGDEFIIAFPGRNSSQVYPIAVGILKIIKDRNFLFMGNTFRMSFSAGIATYPDDADTVEGLIENADKAMYFSKKSGFSKITRYRDMNILKSKRLWLSFAILTVAALISLTGYSFTLPGKGMFFQANKPIKLRNKAAVPVRTDLKTVYFKSGGAVKGVVEKEGDPMIFKVIFDKGEGTISIKKSEILKIESE